MAETGTLRLKTGLAEMLKGGVIMDVVTAEQAKIAEDAGAVAVMALERVPADIRAQGGVARMAAVAKIREIQEAVTIPVMAKVRIGHFVEAQILQALGVDFIDESEVLTPADESFHIDKHAFKVPVRLRRARSRRGAAQNRRRRGADPHQGRGRQRQYRRGGAPRARGDVRDSPPDHPGPDETDDCGEGAGRALRAGADGLAERQAAGAELRRRRSCDARRRGADDAARSGERVRRLGNLQVRPTRPRAPARS